MRVLRHIPTEPADRMALTIGNFDGVHLGHQAMIERVVRAARERRAASCVMTFEPHPRELFTPDQAPTRLTSLREKLELFAGLGLDAVLLTRFDYAFARIAAEEFIARILVRGLAVRWLLVGDDFRFGARRAGDFDLLERGGRDYGFEVVRMDTCAVDGVRVSSTTVRQRLAAGDLDGAARLLGRPYGISGRIVRGDRLGMQLGFPTANVQLEHNRPPVMGIFAVEVQGLAPAPLPGVASLGVRPTIRADGAPVLEVHLFDFDQDIYGRRVQVRFLRKLRDEEKYPDLAALTAAIARDVDNAKDFFTNRRGAQAQSYAE